MIGAFSMRGRDVLSMQLLLGSLSMNTLRMTKQRVSTMVGTRSKGSTDIQAKVNPSIPMESAD